MLGALSREMRGGEELDPSGYGHPPEAPTFFAIPLMILHLFIKI